MKDFSTKELHDQLRSVLLALPEVKAGRKFGGEAFFFRLACQRIRKTRFSTSSK